MNKKLLLLPLFLALLPACVDANVAIRYAERAHPECGSFNKISHRLSGESQTEISMVCDGVKRSITVKCIHGFGLFADTTCHENN